MEINGRPLHCGLTDWLAALQEATSVINEVETEGRTDGGTDRRQLIPPLSAPPCVLPPKGPYCTETERKREQCPLSLSLSLSPYVLVLSRQKEDPLCKRGVFSGIHTSSA